MYLIMAKSVQGASMPVSTPDAEIFLLDKENIMKIPITSNLCNIYNR
jgi:hypothetical protein